MHYARWTRYGDTDFHGRKTHGHYGEPTYVSWYSMKTRCLNPNAASYARYGGRGIRVCTRWMQFENFLADMGMRPVGTTLDRIDRFGNYEPGNCRWATPRQQRLNQGPCVKRTHCHRGHPRTPENVRGRECRACKRLTDAARYVPQQKPAGSGEAPGGSNGLVAMAGATSREDTAASQNGQPV